MFVRKSTHNDLLEDYEELFDENVKYAEALMSIVIQETPNPNATVTRILNIAKEALGIKSEEGLRD